MCGFDITAPKLLAVRSSILFCTLVSVCQITLVKWLNFGPPDPHTKEISKGSEMGRAVKWGAFDTEKSVKVDVTGNINVRTIKHRVSGFDISCNIY